MRLFLTLSWFALVCFAAGAAVVAAAVVPVLLLTLRCLL